VTSALDGTIFLTGRNKFQIPSTDLVEVAINLSHLVPLFLGAAQSDQQQQIAHKSQRGGLEINRLAGPFQAAAASDSRDD
jgi:hypothetical protein